MRNPHEHLVWRRSRLCSSGACVSVAADDHRIYVRDSKDPDGPVLAFTRDAWGAFLTHIQAGEFDIQAQ